MWVLFSYYWLLSYMHLYLLFTVHIWRMGIMILMRANPLQGPATFWARCHTGSKSLDFQGPSLPMALVMDLQAFKAEGKGAFSRCIWHKVSNSNVSLNYLNYKRKKIKSLSKSTTTIFAYPLYNSSVMEKSYI